ncbi:sugar phosphate isomerase/epimerase family protein [Phycicoccus flavus]|uniref:Sugar phosphate isomerase/epimerase n=1 Tax=Phycicoccus flavus TaxID=2502783 RepID=A0A8T6QZ16_9MICO|nr:sugar phosphate isomerase/epimerase family protein [Phycicoccus flavus]NHA67178.1 sugar phosphate isomerase/epimerase [Phycicoccus flavus]
MSGAELLATCWTSAGDASPLGSPRSPLDVGQRVDAVAATGWAGLGLVLADLVTARDTLGFDGLAELVAATGVRHTEVELLDRWWVTGADRAAVDAEHDLLFEAGVALGVRHVKAGPPVDTGPEEWRELVPSLRALARRAAGHGLRVALEPLPFSTVTTMPLGAELVAEVGEPNLGLVVDAWHVFRAGTSLEELAAALVPGSVFAVELDDAAPEVVGTLLEDTVDRRRYPGEGCFDLDGLVRVLAATGFDGPWGVEILSAEHRSRPLLDGLQDARDTAAALLSCALPG